MKKLMATVLLAAAAMSAIVDAYAGPLGGRRSFGRQSNNVTRQVAPATPAQPMRTPANQAVPAQAAPVPPAVQPRPASPWKGILGGALAGFGLAALFSHFGMGGALASGLSSILMILLLVMAVMFVVRMFRRKDTPANSNVASFERPVPAQAYGGAGGTPEIGSNLNRGFQPVAPAASPINVNQQGEAATWGLPADFDKDGFLRQAKSSFIRMQAAWDKGDVADLREFTSPEVFAELKMQIGERQGNDFTDVVRIDADLLGIEDLGNEYMASVKFTGQLKSSPTAAPEAFNEVWNMTKPKAGSGGWVLAGIQQLS